MNAFLVDLPNRPGELAKVTEALAKAGINITGFSGATCGDGGTVCILADDESGARRAIGDAGYMAREVELVTASMANRPGTLAQAARRLADAGVNIVAALPTGMSEDNVQVGFATDNPGKARTALGDLVAMGGKH